MNEYSVLVAMLKDMRDDIRKLARWRAEKVAEEDADSLDPVIEQAPNHPLQGGHSGTLLQYVTVVCSVFPDTRAFAAIKARPTTDSNTFWAPDATLGMLTGIGVPSNLDIPEIGDTLLVTFTGVTSLGASYGLFGGGGGSATQYRLKSVHKDMFICRTLDSSENEGTSDVQVARAYKHRVTPFDAQTLHGLTLTYSTNFVARTATTTTGSNEIQVLIPAYRADEDIIYGIAATTNVPNSLGGYCAVVDLNVDARVWGAL